MSELSALFFGQPASELSETSREVRVGMFFHPSAPSFYQLRAIFKSGRCDPVSASWISSGPALSTDAIQALFPEAERELNEPKWSAERKELEQIRQAMEACLSRSPRTDLAR
jgi:hypothetical protein